MMFSKSLTHTLKPTVHTYIYTLIPNFSNSYPEGNGYTYFRVSHQTKTQPTKKLWFTYCEDRNLTSSFDVSGGIQSNSTWLSGVNESSFTLSRASFSHANFGGIDLSFAEDNFLFAVTKVVLLALSSENCFGSTYLMYDLFKCIFKTVKIQNKISLMDNINRYIYLLTRSLHHESLVTHGGHGGIYLRETTVIEN